MTNQSRPSQQFGRRLQVWLLDLINWPGLLRVLGFGSEGFWSGLVERVKLAGAILANMPNADSRAMGVLLHYLATGEAPTLETSEEDIGAAMRENPSRFFGDMLGTMFANPTAREPFEILGAAIYDSSVAAITGKLAPPHSEATERARAFVGFVTALGALPQLTSAIAEITSVGQIDKLGDNAAQVYFNLGLGFLTWQTMAPILEAAILQPLEIDVQKQWRGKRFSINELQQLYSLGAISRDQLTEGLREAGWRDSDIALVIELAYKDLSRSELVELYHNGKLSLEILTARIRAQGYSPEDVELILSLEVRDDVSDDKKESISVLTSAFKEGLLPERDFRAALEDQNYTPREINLRVTLIRYQQQTESRRLSVSQLKAAWEENVLGDPEVRNALVGLGYAGAEIHIILGTWKAELEPEFLKINQSTILDMYRYAVLDRRTVRDRLLSIGYTEDDAANLIALTEARFPDAFGAAPARKQRFLSLGAVVDLTAMQRLSADDIRTWAQQQGFAGRDVENMVELVLAQAKTPTRPLSQSTIEDAYITGIFTKEQARNALLSIGFVVSDAEIILSTVEKANPAVFAPQTVLAVRQPSISALVQAVMNGFLTQADYFAKAAAIGYTKEGAAVYLANAEKGTSRSSKKLSKSDILEAYKKGIWDYSAAHKALTEQGYSYNDAELLLLLEQKGVESTDIWRALKNEFLEPEDAFLALLGLGFSDAEVTAAFEKLFGASGG